MTTRDTIEKAAKEATAAVATMEAACVRLSEALTDGRIASMPALPSPSNRYWTGPSGGIDTPAHARAVLAQMKEQVDALRAQCAEAAANNTKLYSALALRLESCGLGKQERESHTVRGRTKTEWVTAGWVQSLSRQIPTGDPCVTFDSAYANALRGIDEWERKDAAKKQEADRLREAQARSDRHAQTIGAMATKYGMSLPAGPRDVLDAIMAKNKYLRLAHYLHANRNDWSDGPDYARMGIDGFDAVSADDKAIESCIRSYIDDWDGDGRVFRDCEWSYDRLFALAREQDVNLVADYDIVAEMIE